MARTIISDADGRLATVSTLGALSTNTAGALTITTGTDPAANTECSVTVPAGERWQLCTVQFSLVTSATVATRRVVLTVDNGTTVHAKFPSNVTQAASLTYAYCFAADLGYANGTLLDLNVLTGVPPLILEAGYRIRTATVALDATDNYGAPIVTYIKR